MAIIVIVAKRGKIYVVQCHSNHIRIHLLQMQPGAVDGSTTSTRLPNCAEAIAKFTTAVALASPGSSLVVRTTRGGRPEVDRKVDNRRSLNSRTVMPDSLGGRTCCAGGGSKTDKDESCQNTQLHTLPRSTNEWLLLRPLILGTGLRIRKRNMTVGSGALPWRCS